jgi:hypothetical protein
VNLKQGSEVFSLNIIISVVVYVCTPTHAVLSLFHCISWSILMASLGPFPVNCDPLPERPREQFSEA